MSLRMLDSAGVSASDALIDVGGGASPLIGALLAVALAPLTPPIRCSGRSRGFYLRLRPVWRG